LQGIPFFHWQAECTLIGYDEEMLIQGETNGDGHMWMRSCAVCKGLLIKATLSEIVRCSCGWEWGEQRLEEFTHESVIAGDFSSAVHEVSPIAGIQ